MNYEQLLARLNAGTALTIAELRFLLSEVSTRAAAMPGTITAQTSADDAARIESEHATVIAAGERLRGMIADRERAGGPVLVQPVNPQEAVVAERARISAIRSLARDFRRDDAFVASHIDAGSDELAVRGVIFEEMRAASERNPVFAHAAAISGDEAQTRREGITAALVHRMARSSGDRSAPPVIALPWANRSLLDIAAEYVDYRSASRFLTNRDTGEIIRRAFMTTSDFPGIFTNALGVRLLARYQAATPTYRAWAAPYTVPDFKPVNVIRAGDFPSLQLINEAGEIKSGAFSESKEVMQVRAYGIMLNISRQMMVNDQLGAIDRVLGSSGERIAAWENEQVYASLLSATAAGPTLLTDGVAVFHADHGNLAASGSALWVTSIGVGLVAMMAQKTLDGMPANFMPAVLVVGPATYVLASQLLTAITPAQTSNTVPEFVRNLQLVLDPMITDGSWYLFASPSAAPTFLFGNLEGFEGPRLSSEDVFDVQGMRVKLEHDFGTAAIDYRGAYRNPGV